MRRVCAMSKTKLGRNLRQSTLEESFCGKPRKSPKIETVCDIACINKRETLAAAALKRSTSPNTNIEVQEMDEKPSTSGTSLNVDDTPVILPQKSVESHSTKVHSLGPDLESFPAHRTAPKLPPLKSSDDHTVCVNVTTINKGQPPKPYPCEYVDRRDSNHVFLPCSPHNKYPVNKNTPQEAIVDRWQLMEKALLAPIKSSSDLEEAILSYNSRYKGKYMWKFRELHRLCNKIMTPEQVATLFDKTIPAMPIKMLQRGMNHSITLSQEQIACLLCHAFFSTFPGRNVVKKDDPYPNINFNTLMDTDCKGQKLICILHYFERVTQKMPTGCVTFTRRSMDKVPDWISSDKRLTRLHVSQHGTIEDYGIGMLQMDFANKFVGGGVLGHGLVQEEIRFLICPEMLVSMLFTQVLDDNECLVMTGCERFSLYSGYSDTFNWDAPYIDETPRDDWGRRLCTVVAMDAHCFHSPLRQFARNYIDRELNKAYVSFYANELPPVPSIATGNWGCGAFGGDKEFKSILQLLAAAETGRDVVFFTFADAYLMHQLFSMHKLLTDRKLSVGEVYMNLLQYGDKCVKGNKRPSMSVFDFISSLYIQTEDHTGKVVNHEDTSKLVKPAETEKTDVKKMSKKKETATKVDVVPPISSRYIDSTEIGEFSSPEKQSDHENERKPSPNKSVFDAINEADNN